VARQPMEEDDRRPLPCIREGESLRVTILVASGLVYGDVTR